MRIMDYARLEQEDHVNINIPLWFCHMTLI